MRLAAILGAIVASLSLAACASAPGGITLERPAAVSDQAAMLRTVVGAHNAARAELDIAPLIIDPALSAQALAYANELARSGRFAHSADADRVGQGENLWRGTAGRYSYQQMVRAWIDERRYFTPGVYPNVSTTGRTADVGHYTQIIWRKTTRIGCGVATGNGVDVLVCRYSPPGNVLGQRAY